MNKVFLSGNLVNSATISEYGDAGKVASARIAIPRRKTADGKKETDFFDIKAFGATAGYIASYSQAGDKIELSGRIQNRTYEKNGEKRIYTEIIIEECEIISKSQGQRQASIRKEESTDDLPF